MLKKFVCFCTHLHFHVGVYIYILFCIFALTDLTTFIKLLEQPNYTTVVKTLNAGINLDDDDDLVEGVFFKPQQQEQQQRQHQQSESSKKHPSNKQSQESTTDDEDMNVDVENKKETVKIKDNENKNYEDLQNQEHSQASSAAMRGNRAGGLTKEAVEEQQRQHNTKRQQDKNLNIGYCHLTKALERDFNKTVFLWPCPHMKVSTIFNYNK